MRFPDAARGGTAFPHFKGCHCVPATPGLEWQVHSAAGPPARAALALWLWSHGLAGGNVWRKNDIHFSVRLVLYDHVGVGCLAIRSELELLAREQRALQFRRTQLIAD